MTPRRFSAALALALDGKAEDGARLFSIIRSAQHADKKGADEFLKDLLGG